MSLGWWRRARGSVRLRVTVLAAGAFAVVLALAAFILLRVLEDALVDDVQSANEEALELQATRLIAAGGVPDGAEMVLTSAGPAFALPTAGQREVVAFTPGASTTITESSLPPDIMFERTLPSASAEVLGVAGRADEFSVSSLRIGGVVLATATSLDNVRDTIDTTGKLLWVLGPALVALVAGLAWLLAGRALRPVHAVTSRVASIGSHSLHERVPVPGSSDEIAELATTMNDMLGRLESASTTNRRLVSDASHELRTPVAVMRTELEVARLAPGNDWAGTTGVLLDELDRLQGLIDDLLLLARGDERGFDRTPFSIADVARDVAARPRRVRVEVTGDDVVPSEVIGDEQAVRRAVDHVVGNAARHATSIARVTIRPRRRRRGARRRRRRTRHPPRPARRRRAPVRPPRRGPRPRRWRRRPRSRRRRRCRRRPRWTVAHRRVATRWSESDPLPRPSGRLSERTWVQSVSGRESSRKPQQIAPRTGRTLPDAPLALRGAPQRAMEAVDR